jgi:hypothetical protein
MISPGWDFGLKIWQPCFQGLSVLHGSFVSATDGTVHFFNQQNIILERKELETAALICLHI